MMNKNRNNLGYTQTQKLFTLPAKKNSEPPFIQHHKENILTINPAFNQNSARPLISPKKQQQQQLQQQLLSDRTFPKATEYRQSQHLRQPKNPHNFATEREHINCCNHPTKAAEFKVDSNEGLQYFCGRCAAQLATQGYEVERMANSGASMKASKRNELPILPHYEGEPIYEQILQMLKECNTVIQQHNVNIQKFSNLEQEYNQQIGLTTAFYDRLVEIIEEMKQDHLNDLIQQRDKYTQIADIENDSLRENIIEVNVIKNDVENHIEEVLEGIKLSGNTAECRESLDHYRQKLAFFRHRTQEQLDELSQVTRYSQQKIDRMFEQFENFLKTMWDEGDFEGADQQREERHHQPVKPNMNSVMTVKNIHQILPRGISYQGQQEKRAFRNLQSEQEQIEEPSMQQRKSPNFKKI